MNAAFPWEVKAGNDLYRVRENYPELIMFGGMEKECLSIGNGIQPLATFENMCKFLTLLHEITGNPKGEFPRMQP